MPAQDDQARFTEIYERESDSLFRFCLFRVSDREQARDLTQETFARLWGSMASKKPIDNPRAFLFMVARHLVIDWYRKTKSYSLDAMSNQDDGRPFDIEDKASLDEIETHSDANKVMAMMNQLEPQYKEVVYLRYVEDLPPKDIAHMLDLNANTVSVRITRGMECLRKLMGVDNKK